MKLVHKAIFISALFLHTALAFGEWTTYTTADGLPDYIFPSLAVSDEGTVWIGGMNRITSFDGENCETYIVPGDSSLVIYSIAVDKSGNVWFGGFSAYTPAGGGGYVYYSKGVGLFKEGNFTFYTVSDGLPDNRINQLAIAENGTVWAATQNGAAFLRDGKWTSVHIGDNPVRARAVAVAPDGAVWFGSKDVYRYHNGSWETYPTSQFLDFSITVISFDDRGRPWIGAYSRDLYFYDGEQWIDRTPLSYYVLPANTRGPEIIALEFGPDGSLWCGVPGPGGGSVEDLFGGVYHLDRDYIYDFDNASWKKSLWIRYHMGYGLQYNSVMALAVARDGTVWAGTSYGLSRYTPTSTEVEEENAAPRTFSILGNRPNPFNPSTTISFSLSAPEKVTLTIYDITGRKVREFLSGPMSKGEHKVVWDASDCASGVYFCTLRAGSVVHTRKMLLVR